MRHEAEFETFFVAQYDRMVRSVTMVAGDRSVAEAAVQTAFARAQNRWRRLRGRDDVPSVIVRDAIAIALHEQRPTARPGADTGVASRGEPTNTIEVLCSLPDGPRAVGTLSFVDSVPADEIGPILGLDGLDVNRHLSTARDALVAFLEPEAVGDRG